MTPRPGEPLSVEFFAQLKADILQTLIQDCIGGGPGILLGRPGGQRLTISATGRGRSKSTPFAPFAGVFLGKDEGASKAIIRIKRGTLNDVEPTLSGDVTEEDTGWWRFHVSPSTTVYAVLRATLASDGTVTARRLTMEASPSVTAAGNETTGDPPQYAYRKLFKVVTDGNYQSTITPYSTGAQQASVIISKDTCTQVVRNVIWIP